MNFKAINDRKFNGMDYNSAIALILMPNGQDKKQERDEF